MNTAPHRASAPTHYRLSRIDTAPGVALTLEGLPQGACLSDGLRQITVARAGASIDISRWQLHALRLSLPGGVPPPAQLHLLALTCHPGRHPGRLHTQRYPVSLHPLPDSAPAQEKERSPGLWLQGLPAGTWIGDGLHTWRSTSDTAQLGLSAWNLSRLVVRPPKGWHAPLTVRVQAIGQTPESLAAMGPLQLRLASPNAYASSPLDTLAHQSLPVMDIVVEGWAPLEAPAPTISYRAAQFGSERTATTSAAEFDDAQLSALERKLRLN